MAKRLNAETARQRKALPAPDPVEEESEAEETDADRRNAVTDETILTCTREAVLAYEAMALAQEKVTKLRGKYRAKLKDAKAMGVDPDAIRSYLRDRERDPLEVDRELRDRMRVAQLMGLPIGAQLDIFGAGESVAAGTDRTQAEKQNGTGSATHKRAHKAALKAQDKRVKEAKAKGLRDGKAGKPMVSGYPGASAEHQAYVYAYDEGQALNLNGLGKGPKGLASQPNEEDAGKDNEA